MKNPTEKIISKIIPPQYSSWQTIELSYQCAQYAIYNNIEGDFVECGVAAGNNFAAMCFAGRKGVGFDSFVGIPWAGENDDEQPGKGLKDKSKEGILETSGISAHSIKNVQNNMNKWGVENYELIEGWFQYTVPKWDGKIAVLRLDGDLYDSTYICLEHLYPKLSKGGILIIDDWQLTGCKKAFNDYFKERPELLLDNGVSYWKKV